MLRTVFAVTLCLLALQCYSASALAAHLDCDALVDAITYCSGDSSIASWTLRWCERCCEGYSVQDTGFDHDIFVDNSTSPNSVISDSLSLSLAMSRAEALAGNSNPAQQALDRAHYLLSGKRGSSYVPTDDDETFGPSNGGSTGSCPSGTTYVVGVGCV